MSEQTTTIYDPDTGMMVQLEHMLDVKTKQHLYTVKDEIVVSENTEKI